ncbi:MAG: hypothetical protein HOJ16_07780 [Candidatus Peribacter sp.]|jgi:hypothetical protein|nr:hypothetical protein [Candidatus Peribacter sp.]
MPHKEIPGKVTEMPFAESKLENIDKAMLNYIDGILNLSVTMAEGFKKVPVIWASAERAYQVKREDGIRDKSGALIMPLITVDRTSVVKDPGNKGTIQANILPVNDAKGGSIQVARRIKQDKTSNFMNTKSKRKRGQLNFPSLKQNKVVYETISIPIPVYVTITYSVVIRTEYQQQMNELITSFITSPGGINYIILKDGEHHRYEGFIQQDYSFNNNLSNFSNEERKFETTIQIEVLGYVFGSGENQDQPKMVIRESAVEIKIARERTVLADELEYKNGQFYGLPGINPRDHEE